MEATSDYWKPFYFLMEHSLPVMLVNARQARNIPGRKTDVSDAAWLAQLAAHGLLRALFVPPEPVRELRDLTRARAIAVRDRTRQVQRLEKFLESTGIKLSSVASELMGASSRVMLDALVAGERDPVVLAGMAKGVLRKKPPELEAALHGRFTETNANGSSSPSSGRSRPAGASDPSPAEAFTPPRPSGSSSPSPTTSKSSTATSSQSPRARPPRVDRPLTALNWSRQAHHRHPDPRESHPDAHTPTSSTASRRGTTPTKSTRHTFTRQAPFEMDLAVLSKDHTVTVASFKTTRSPDEPYTTLLDATPRRG